jgi:homocysteine S-methyltransferase
MAHTAQRKGAAELFENTADAGSTVLCDGAMGTMFYSRGVFINRCYDELNISQAEMVRAVHEEYLQAGAEVIETNTFGANRFRLERHGLADKVREINRAGIRIARECVDAVWEKHATEAFVAGALGPLGVPVGREITAGQAYEAFAEQARALAEGGPGVGADLLVVETMMSMAEAEQAIRAAKTEASSLPLMVMVTVDDAGNCLDGTPAEEAARLLTLWGAEAVGCNCGDGPGVVLGAIERMRGATHLPLAAMPNAGVPKAVEGRTIYMTSPEYMASFARKMVKAGATFVGGCCGTTPAHIRAVRGALRAVSAMAEGQGRETRTEAREDSPGVTPAPLGERSRVGAKVAAGEFVTLVEIVPPKGIDCAREMAGASQLYALGVDAINVPDAPRASARMSAGSLCVQIQQHVGIETVLHFTCRDRNTLGLQGDLLGASSIGVRNILCLTGDPPKLGNYPDATAVFDVDAIGLVKIVRDLNHGLDIGKNPIGASTGFTISVAANPGVPDVENEIRRFAAKVEAGAEFAITQPVFDLRLLEEFLRRVESFRIPVIAGIWPLTSVRNAEFMRNDLKVSMPEEILVRMAQAATPDAARAEGVRIAREMLAEVRGRVQGVQVSAPFGKYRAAAEVLGLVEAEG